MKIDTRKLAMSATTKALQIRKEIGVAQYDPVSIFDIVDQMGVELRMTDIPSMEGIYLLGDRPTIILSSLRPKGRQFFTCAHELGHHVFGHGEKFDHLVDLAQIGSRQEADEFTADCFAGIFLMPRLAVVNAFKVSSQSPETALPIVYYKISTLFGVGYSTLINHMFYALKLISRSRYQKLLATQVSSIRKDIFGRKFSGNLFVIDDKWSGRAIDIECADLCVLPSNFSVESEHLDIIEQDNKRLIVKATSSGLGRLEDPSSDWSAYVRVSKKGFVGRAKFRFQEDE